MGVFPSVDCAKSNSAGQSSLWAVLRWLWKGVAGEQAPGLFVALAGTFCDPGQAFLLACVLCRGSLPQPGK